MMDAMDHHIEEHGLTPPDPQILAELQSAAKNYNLARRTVTFKPQENVLQKFKARAEKEGIPYQALLNSVMKKYAE
jgi:predicted DNA binding CopG/RHH family protein